MKPVLDENVIKCFWMKVFLDDFFCNLDESVPNLPCNTENFVPIVVPSLSNSSSGSDSSTSRTLSRQGSHYSTSSSSSPTVVEIQTREREDRTESDIFTETVSTTVDERSGRPDVDQANKNRKTNKKGTQEGTKRPVVYRLRSCKF